MESKKHETQQTGKSSGESKTEQQTSDTAAEQRFTKLDRGLFGAYWSENLGDICAICKNELRDPCIECPANQTDEDCPFAWGACNCGFHFHCISKLLKTRDVCPDCNIKW